MKQILTALCLFLLFTSARMGTAAGEGGFVSIFNGKDLTGWDGTPGWWRVEDGALTAQSTPEKPCAKANYLIWRGGQPADFELRLRFRLQGGNSGIQLRSRELPDWDTSGYQADMDAEDQYTGGVYEHTRGVIAPRGQKVVIAPDGTRQVTSLGDPVELRKRWKLEDWNDYRIVARGSELTLFINGVMTAQADDRQANRAASRGILAFQMHPGPPMKVQFKDIRLKTFTNSAPSQSAIPSAAPTIALAGNASGPLPMNRNWERQRLAGAFLRSPSNLPARRRRSQCCALRFRGSKGEIHFRRILTLTLSPSAGEREQPTALCEISAGRRAILSRTFALGLWTILPLPFGRGEGRGEGFLPLHTCGLTNHKDKS